MEQICANNMDKKGVTSGIIIFARVLKIMRIILWDFSLQTDKKLCHNQCSPRHRVCGRTERELSATLHILVSEG